MDDELTERARGRVGLVIFDREQRWPSALMPSAIRKTCEYERF